tara:strand:+ start:1124 stop:1918 length:795 start_codon:yes stop_codon:yes gene_type:complete
MASLLIPVQNEAGASIGANIQVSAELYIQYINSSDSDKALTSTTLAEVGAITNDKGEVSLDSARIATSKEFTRYVDIFLSNKAKGQGGTFRIVASTITTDQSSNFVTGFDTIFFDLHSSTSKLSKDKVTGNYNLPALTAKTTIQMVSKSSSKVALDKLEKTFLEKETQYLQAKRVYQENIKILDTSKIFEQLNDYEPPSWNKAITRLLEFEESTLDAAIRFTKKTNLTAEFKYLDQIKTAIFQFKNLYPSILINDGDGVPYKPS